MRGTKFLTDVGVIYESIQYQFNPSCRNPDEEKNEGFHKTFWGTTKKFEKKTKKNLILISIQLSEMHGTLSVKYKDFKFMYHEKY